MPGDRLPGDLPPLPGTWSWRTLESLTGARGICYGVVQPGKPVADGVPIVRVKDFSKNFRKDFAGGSLDARSLMRIDRVIEGRYARSRLRGGEILLSLVGSPGQVAIVPDTLAGANIARAVALLPVECEARYISLCLRSPLAQHYVRTWATTTVQATLNLRDVRRLPVPWPTGKERMAIAAVLGALDDKIVLNQAMNRTLEDMARAIFRSWFVHFDGHTDLVDSQLGAIPRGWAIRSLEDITSYLRRGLQPKYVDRGGVLVVNQRCVRDGRVTLDKARRHDDGRRSVRGREVRAMDILVNSTGVGTLGRVGIVPHFAQTLIVDSHVTVVRANPEIVSPHVLGIAMRLREGEIAALGEGTTGQTELSRRQLQKLPFVVAPKQHQAAFDGHVAPMVARIEQNEEESTMLARLRDALLPRLTSGLLRVSEAEKAAARIL